jgi:hypothetical protein
MALNPAKLAAPLGDLFQGKPVFPKDTAEAGQKWAALYREYAQGAQAGATFPVAPALAAAETALAKDLGNAFKSAQDAGIAGIAVLLPLLDAAFLKFWATPIPFVAPPPPAPPSMAGVVTPPVPATLATLMAAVLPAGLAPGASPSSQANAVSAALDAWTKSVTVVNTPVTPPGPPLPAVPLA